MASNLVEQRIPIRLGGGECQLYHGILPLFFHLCPYVRYSFTARSLSPIN
jgi:hypothetical protein